PPLIRAGKLPPGRWVLGWAGIARKGRLAACAWLALCMLPARAEALPFMRLFLDGDVETLGRGGAEGFHDPGAEALRLERPALLSGASHGFLSLSLGSEATLILRAGPWAGTRADNQELGLTAVIPIGAP